MPKVSIDGIEVNLPYSVTTKQLLNNGQAQPDDMIYRMEDDGNQRVLSPDEEITLSDGARFGTLSPFKTAGGSK